MRSLLFILVTALLAGCGPQNTGLNTVQISSATMPRPENHLEKVSKIVAGRQHGNASIQVSTLQTMVGAGVFEPQRWYVCVLGINPVVGKPADTVWGLVDKVVDERSAAGVYNLIVIFGETSSPDVREGYDSPLCRNAVYSPLELPA